METPSPANSENVLFPGTMLSTFLESGINAAANPIPTPTDNDDEDLDGCCVPVDEATADEDLPPAEGGVA